MKKKICRLLVLIMILFMTGCSFGLNKNNSKEIVKGYKTYAFKMNHWVKDGIAGETYKYVIRYDKNGNLKYYKYLYTMGANIDDIEIELSDAELLKKSKEGDCSKVQSLNYTDYQTICRLRNGQVAMLGFIITDKTIASGILNDNITDSVVEQGLKEFNEFSTEEKAKIQFSKLKDKLSASNKDTLIIANEQIELNN